MPFLRHEKTRLFLSHHVMSCSRLSVAVAFIVANQCSFLRTKNNISDLICALLNVVIVSFQNLFRIQADIDHYCALNSLHFSSMFPPSADDCTECGIHVFLRCIRRHNISNISLDTMLMLNRVIKPLVFSVFAPLFGSWSCRSRLFLLISV